MGQKARFGGLFNVCRKVMSEAFRRLRLLSQRTGASELEKSHLQRLNAYLKSAGKSLAHRSQNHLKRREFEVAEAFSKVQVFQSFFGLWIKA